MRIASTQSESRGPCQVFGRRVREEGGKESERRTSYYMIVLLRPIGRPLSYSRELSRSTISLDRHMHLRHIHAPLAYYPHNVGYLPLSVPSSPYTAWPFHYSHCATDSTLPATQDQPLPTSAPPWQLCLLSPASVWRCCSHSYTVRRILPCDTVLRRVPPGVHALTPAPAAHALHFAPILTYRSRAAHA